MGADRIAQAFAACAKEGRAAFVGYLMADDPTPDISLGNIQALAAAGADVIELGAPFTDPMADGVAIQKAAQRALAAGGSLSGTLEIARRFRIVNTSTPLIVMGYANPIHRMGFSEFARRAAEAGVDGVITVDLPPEEDAPLRTELARNGLAVIRLATPTTTEGRMARVADGAAGFVYYVSVAGVTGAGVGAEADIAAGVNRARKASNLPVAVGFGVRTPDQAAVFARIADGVVVGSALVEEVRAAVESGQPESSVNRISVVAEALSNAISSARTLRSVH
ncbi:MAG: tryptophan synthase subunit alpha [Alphaproteobacteria bacterium]|nr:tryptophan synthase subunit alpha [Alphaproteobacteria bacterium]